MDQNRKRNAANWLWQTIFQDEPIARREPKPPQHVPSLIRAARSLEKNRWQSRENLFLNQGKLLVNFEDDHPFDDNIVRYFPTYASLSDEELRGYLTWRTRVRRGEMPLTCLTFVFLYIYELLNQIGAEDPMDGYRKLTDLRDRYGALDGGILPYLEKWIPDYVVYYDLDPALLEGSPRVVFDGAITVLENIDTSGTDSIVGALKILSGRWLERSKFYAAHKEDMDAVMVRVMRRVSLHYRTRCKRDMIEQFFGARGVFQVQLFESAVFCDPLRRINFVYDLDPRCTYLCVNASWRVKQHTCPLHPNTKLAKIVKTIDAVMRDAYGYKSAIRQELDTKWLMAIIRDEVRIFLEEKKAADSKKIKIDFSRLSAIRREASITQERLTVEDELEDDPPDIPEPNTPATPADPPAPEGPLSPVQYRLLQSLLYGKNLDWIQAEGHILSVLVDSINDILYDTFQDTVLDDTPALIEDYIDELKEMVHP